MAFASRERERGGLLVRDMYNLLRTTLLKLASVLLARKVYSCRQVPDQTLPGTDGKLQPALGGPP